MVKITKEIAKDPFSAMNIPRKVKKRGGSLLLISRTGIKVKLLEIINSPFYECAVWLITIGSKELTLMGIYHPPQPTGCNLPFIDQLLDLTGKYLTGHKNVIIMGDFNIHVNDFTDADATHLIDAMLALGCNQLVKHSTHRLGNILDLIFISENSAITSTKTVVTDMLSDHRFVISQLNVGKPRQQDRQISIRKIDDELIKLASNDFNCINILKQDNLSDTIQAFNEESQRFMDTNFPTKVVTTTSKIRVPWYDKATRDQRKIVRKRERCWLRYAEDHHWKAYKRERQRYHNMIRYNKRQVYSSKVLEVKGDIKKLYQVMHGLTGNPTNTEFPSGYTKDQLVEEFASFFLDKIETIRNRFHTIPPYEPTVSDVHKLCKFRPMTRDEITKLIMSMKTKSCELDILPTRVLKEILHNCIDSIVKIVNLSLEFGFDDSWKTAIVRPPLKEDWCRTDI